MKNLVVILLAVAAVVVGVTLFVALRDVEPSMAQKGDVVLEETAAPSKGAQAKVAKDVKPVAEPKSEASTEKASGSKKAEAVPAEESPNEENDSTDEADEERAVEAFDAMVDGWQEAKPKGVSNADVANFRKAFSSLPRDRKMEGLQRALNLIPDENVLLLAGILLDKTQDREVLDAVFSDVLNRDESVKTEILKTIHKDKSHPCWADTAWILDVTGEKQ